VCPFIYSPDRARAIRLNHMFNTHDRHITQFDHDRLWRVAGHAGERPAADDLENQLDRATVVPARQVPPDVVTMNSQLEVEDLQTGDRKVVTVVFPDAADARAGKVSVLAPLGVAVLGSRVGEVVECHRPGGPRRLRVNRLLFQPEAAGRYDL
jgi:regulator of nucleoside diphosphate kinase